MTREETKTIIRAIKAAFPTYKPDNLTETINVWFAMLEDQDYRIISMSLKNYIRNNKSGFAPSIGQLMDYADKISSPEEMTAAEAWGMVKKAIKNSAYNSLAEYAKLPETIQKAVGSPEQLASMAIDPQFNEGVESSNFARSYNLVVSRKKEMQKMTEEALQLMKKVNEGSPKQLLERQNAEKIERMQSNRLIEAEHREPVPMPDEIKEKMKELVRGIKND